jgi:oxaloacetate decarboxylase alpha subunit
MAHIEIIDQTIRDGQQSLWGMRMQAGTALPVTPLIDRTGYSVVDFVGSSMFEIMVRHARENPWEGLDLVVQSLPHVRVRAGMRCHGIITMSVTPNDLMDLWVRRLCEHGVRSFWIHDPLHCNVDKLHRLARVAAEYGAEVVLALMYCFSPVHTDAYYADRAKALAASAHVTRLILYDMGGLLTPERTRTLVPAVKSAAGTTPVEIHSHNVTGLAPLVYLEAIAQGLDIIHTCSRPLANGASLPSIEMTLRNLELLGHTTDIDESLLAPVAEHFERVARTAGFPLGVPNEYDLWVYEHQIPGGMTGTLRNQLAQHHKTDRLDEVLREVADVRRELGYPPMATPFSQLVGTVAVMNVLTGKRWSSIPDEVIQYAYGYYGQPVAPIDPEVMDMIDSHPRAREIRGTEPPNPSLAEIRKQYGGVPDDELILRFLVAEDHVEAMKRAGPVRRDYPLIASPELERARELLATTSARYLAFASADLRLQLRR